MSKQTTDPTADDIHQVKIRLNMAGMGTIEVDGHDIANHVESVDIHSQAGEITQVTLHMPQGVEFDGASLVKVVQTDTDAATLRAEADAVKVPGYGRVADLIRFHLQGADMCRGDRAELAAFADYLDAKPTAMTDPAVELRHGVRCGNPACDC